MQQTAFVDNKLIEELNKISSEKDNKVVFPEHDFLAMCVRNNISYEYLENFTYVDVMKILISFIHSNEENKEATQTDIDRLLK